MTVDSKLFSIITRTIQEQNLFRKDDTLVVALSGGADSTSLLDLLSNLPGYNLKLIAAHLNHCLRGVESDADEQFCRKLSDSYGIPFELQRVDVKSLARSEGLNLEDAGRRARINFLDQIREKYCAVAVVTAHHSDDQAETILMRLLRGSGMTGLSGMQYRNQRGYCRPMLGLSRAQIERYLTERGLHWREDVSNQDTTFLRNRIRHELLPLLEQYNPAIRQTLNTTASIIAEENALLDKLAKGVYEDSWRRDDNVIACSITEFKANHLAMQRRVLRHAFKQLAGNLDGFSLEHTEAILQLLDSPHPNAKISLPQNLIAAREYDRIQLRFRTEPTPDAFDEITIKVPGCYPLPSGGSLEITICSSLPDFKNLPANIACFDLDKAPLPWLVRTFRPGDRITPLGMSGRKKVKDVFIDKKIPLSRRKHIPILVSGGELIWIAGVCASELYRIDNQSNTLVQVTWCE